MTDFSTVADLYHNQDPASPSTYERRQQEITAKFTSAHRQQLVDAVRPFLTSVDAPASSFSQLQRLLHPDATVVVAGQQAGLFTGPLYSVYKALSAVGLAKRLEAELQKPVIPVFWIASEDHDWGEVDHAYLLDASDNVQRIRLKESAPLHQMVHHFPVAKTSADRALTELAEILPQGPWRTEVLEAVNQSYQSSSTLVGWFARLMYKLLGDTGLIMVDPCLDGLRQLVSDVWKGAIEQRTEIATALGSKYETVQSRGFEPAVVRDETNTSVFYVMDGKRFVLERTDHPNRLAVRGLGIEDSVEGWLKKAKESPGSFSSNVLLRPVVQDFLLPTLAFVGGPAEIAYHALAGGVFEGLGRQMPPLLVRDRVAVYPPTVRRNMEKWGIDVSDLARPVDLQSGVLQSLGGELLDQDMNSMIQAVETKWNEWAGRHRTLGPQIESMAKAQVQREIASLRKTTTKAKNLLARAKETELRQLRHIEKWVWTDGHAQERRLCPLNLWTRYGVDWLQELPFWGDYTATRGVYDVLI